MRPRFFFPFIFLALLSYDGGDAYTDEQKKAIRAKLDPSAFSCMQETGVTRAQVEIAKAKRSINEITACFFTCFLKKNKLFITDANGVNFLDVPAFLIFVQTFIPTIGLLNIGPILLESAKCVILFTADSRVDTPPGCPRTKALVTCLVNSPNFIAAILKASRSDVTFTLKL